MTKDDDARYYELRGPVGRPYARLDDVLYLGLTSLVIYWGATKQSSLYLITENNGRIVGWEEYVRWILSGAGYA
jgi:hypothetical protein